MRNEDALFDAMLARDPRFDGKFFVGVKTTGVYCRPICPARPSRKNVEFFATAQGAERAGYRPCLRCRPEAAPGSPAWHARSAVVRRALQRIGAGELWGMDEEGFAAGLGLSARHLRRLFREELGTTPKQIGDAQRLNFARSLVVETALPLTAVALTAGFASVRRFNAAFRGRFGRAPSALRRRREGTTGAEGWVLTLAYRPPYDFTSLLAFYGAHAIPGLEEVTERTYARVFKLGGAAGWVEVQEQPERHALRMRVVGGEPGDLFELTRRIRRMFDLDADPVLVANAFAAGGGEVLRRLQEKRPGLRLPRGFDAFETGVCAILGQLVSMGFARTLAGQVVLQHGERVTHPVTGATVTLFPGAGVLAEAGLERLGTTRARKGAVRAFARAVAEGRLALSEAQDPAAFRAGLLALPGIGAWTAEYMSLRCIADTDAFPGTDLILKRAVDLHPGLDLEAVKPWRAYAAIHLWKEFAEALSKRRGKGLRAIQEAREGGAP